MLCVSDHAEGAEFRIAVIMGLDEAPFEGTLSGFQEELKKRGIKIYYDMYRIKGDPAKAYEAIQKIKTSQANLILCLGSIAADAAVKEIANIPILATLCLRLDKIKKVPNATGISMEIPLETQFKWVQRILKDAKTIAVIYNPDENRKRVEEAARVASGMGLKLESQEVNTPQDVLTALEKLSKKADALWTITDNLISNPQIAKGIMQSSFKNKVPVIGLSLEWVKAGALYSLDWDYKDMGEQCGELAQKILEGARPSSIPHASPRKLTYSLNLNTATQMKVTISEELRQGAYKVAF
jgi:putative ABC transport system substrate-binding protein